jgi:trehalose/maltose hydrolase-like predicted phosphorylase
MCAEVGHLQLAYEYAHEAALIDLRDLHHNTRDGLHMAALAGSWIALVAGFGGLRDGEGVLALDPMLPEGIRRLRFRLVWRGVRLLVDVDHRRVTYTIRDGSDARLVLRHAGEPVVVTADRPLTVPLGRRTPSTPPPTQPAGRAPVPRATTGRD